MLKGRTCYIIPNIENEINNIINEKKITGKNKRVIAQERFFEYAIVGKRIEKMYENMTLGLYKDRRK